MVDGKKKNLKGYTALVTSGPTREPIDPVRYISNYSSGRQGHAIAQALADMGAKVTLVSGPVSIPDPKGVKVVRVTTALEMLAACEKALPADIAVFVAAVADWRAKKISRQKIKKTNDWQPSMELVENPDILKTIATRKKNRPPLVIGFAAETNNLMANAKAKLEKKGCDWILANEVGPTRGFDSSRNDVVLLTGKRRERWEGLTKTAIARKLARAIHTQLKEKP